MVSLSVLDSQLYHRPNLSCVDDDDGGDDDEEEDCNGQDNDDDDNDDAQVMTDADFGDEDDGLPVIPRLKSNQAQFNFNCLEVLSTVDVRMSFQWRLNRIS